MSYHSQFGEDKWIAENLAAIHSGPKLFCEVGAFDGVQSSNTLFFEEDWGWDGLCIEPSLKPFYECQANRKSQCVHLAVASETCFGKFYLHPSDPGRGSLLPIKDGKEIGCGKGTLCNIWTTWFSPESLYLLSIDTEGTELDVWASRGTISPEIVIIEYLQWGSDEKKQPICQQLDKDGYKVVRCTEANLIFVKK